ncbi:MAG: hypothetical protein IJ725_05180 [Ruminococcus sp.]|nr:hypothetical protein [Ruminococcus sp.]
MGNIFNNTNITQQGNENNIHIGDSYKINFGNRNIKISEMDYKEIDYKKMIKNEIIKASISFVFTIITFTTEQIISDNNSINPIFPIVISILIFIGFSLFLFFLYQIIVFKIENKRLERNNTIRIRKFFDYLLSLIHHLTDLDTREIPDKVIIRKGERTYQLTGCTCPICTVGDIGKMKFIKVNGELYLRCNENSKHIIRFDSKSY